MSTQAKSSSTPADRRKAALMRLLIAAGVVLLVLIIVYFVGLSRGRAQLASQKTGYEGQLKTARAQAADAQAQAAALQRQNKLMAARGLLYQAAVSLDRRNFGIADTHVTQAGEALDSLPPGADAAPAAAVRQAVGETKISVSRDLDTQRNHLLDMAEQLDALIH